jgi:predicted nucleic acid-binding protein
VNALFVDSFDLIALINPKDAYHGRAVSVSRGIVVPLITTHWVLVEVADALKAPAMRVEVVQFLRDVATNEETEVVGPSTELYERGLDLFARRADKRWSLTDCISFVVMSERGLTEALTGDHHFEQAGFRAVLSDG